jgi:tyrosine phenol-lyase
MTETREPTADAAPIRWAGGEELPLELHKVRMVQSLTLPTLERRRAALEEAGFNSFLLSTRDVFLDMLTDSGTNAMSDRQVASMLMADDAYAGSQSFERMRQAVEDVFGKPLVLPVHQGRAAEHILFKAFVSPGQVVPMNYHFTTTKAHIELPGGEIAELFTDEALKVRSDFPFKGNIDLGKLRALLESRGADAVPFIRMEASTNLIGGQPFSMENLHAVRRLADEYKRLVVLDASLIGENAYFIRQREAAYRTTSIADILREMCAQADIVYFSSRKVSSTRGGAICTARQDLFDRMKDLVILYEGFLTYGGMSVREVEAMAVGLRETQDETVISQSPSFIAHLVNRLSAQGVPVITPPGAMGFLPHVPQAEYPAGALVAAFYLVSGVRGMERGTISSVRLPDGTDLLSDLELMRLAMPRRVFTLSQVRYVEDRLTWLHRNRDLVGGLRFREEPRVLRFFLGKLEPTSDWPERLMAKFRADLGDSR